MILESIAVGRAWTSEEIAGSKQWYYVVESKWWDENARQLPEEGLIQGLPYHCSCTLHGSPRLGEDQLALSITLKKLLAIEMREGRMTKKIRETIRGMEFAARDIFEKAKP